MPGNMGTPPPPLIELMLPFYMNAVEGRLSIGQWFATNDEGQIVYEPKINVFVSEDRSNYYIQMSASERHVSRETLEDIAGMMTAMTTQLADQNDTSLGELSASCATKYDRPRN
jgi:hypothetical protein